KDPAPAIREARRARGVNQGRKEIPSGYFQGEFRMSSALPLKMVGNPPTDTRIIEPLASNRGHAEHYRKVEHVTERFQSPPHGAPPERAQPESAADQQPQATPEQEAAHAAPSGERQEPASGEGRESEPKGSTMRASVGGFPTIFSGNAELTLNS